MPQTHTVTSYAFDELSDDAKQVALDKMRDLNVDHEWWDCTYDDAKACAALIGIEIDQIYFSGFWSQGDGACFTGSYRYAKGGLAALKAHAPQETELHRIASELQTVQRAAFYRLTASVSHTGHYSHEMCARVSVSQGDNDAPAEIDETITELLRDYMRWIYKRLESEHEYLTSDEQVKESIEANEYQFTETGDLYR